MRDRVLRWTVITLALLAVASLLPRAISAASTPVTVGYRDFAFSGGQPPGGDPDDGPTGEKPQSKLWFNDGLWWGALLDRASGQFHIFRFSWPTQSWTDTGTLVDDRSNSHADTLWDGTHLYIASAGPSSDSRDAARFLRYSYNPATKSYTLDPGFPLTLTSTGMEAVVLAKDSLGHFWITYTQFSTLYVTHSLASDQTWVSPFVPPVSGTDLDPDDIAAIIAFNGKVGILWSNQVSMTMNWTTHTDGDPDTVWQTTVTAYYQGPRSADDHINLKTLQADPSGQIFAAIKTSFDDLPNPNPDDPLIVLLVMAPTGRWSAHVFGTVGDNHTRPLVLIDDEHRQVYMFASAPPGGGAVYYKQASLDNLTFPAGLGTVFIQSSTDTYIDNVTSTRQNVNGTTGILVEASDLVSGYYLHNTLTLATGTPTKTPTAGPTSTNTRTPTVTSTATPTNTPGAYLAEVLADNPVSYWRLGELSGPTAADSGDGGNPGAIQPGVTLGVPGALVSDPNAAMSFNGATGYISVADKANLDLTGDFTLEAWAKPAALDGLSHAIVHKGDATGYSVWQYRLSLTSANRWRGTVFIGNQSFQVTDTGTPQVGRWDHLVMTRSGSTVTLYVNATPVATTSAVGSLNTSTGMLAIGRTGEASSDYFNGGLDEIAVYNIALPAGRIVAHYNAAYSGSTPTPTLTPTSTATGTPTSTVTPTRTATSTPTNSPTATITTTPTVTPTPTLTGTPTATSTTTTTPTPTSTPTPTNTPGAYVAEVLADNPVSYWRLGELGGATAADSGDGGNPGAIQPGVALGVPGALTGDGNTAMSFNGATGYISVADKANLDLTGDFTLEAWAKPAALDGLSHAIVHKGDVSGYTVWQYRLSVTSGNLWRGTVFMGNTNFTVTSTAPAATNRWDHLVMTRSGSTVTLYVNATPVATASAAGSLNTSTGMLAIGRTGSSSSDYFDGAIDEVAVYNTALSASRVRAHYNAAAFAPLPTAPPTATATNTRTPTSTATPTDIPTATATLTNTATPLATPTETPTNTATPAATPTYTATPIDAPTATPTDTPTSTPPTATAMPTSIATPTDTPTATPTPTDTPTSTATPRSPATPTDTPTSPATPTHTVIAAATPTGTPTASATPTYTVTSTATPTSTPTSTVTATVTASATPTFTGSSYQATVLSDNPVSYWRLGELSGTVAADSGSGANPGTIQPGVTLGAPGALLDDPNTAMTFNGTSGYVRVADKTNLDPTGNFTLEAWAKPAVLDGVGHAVVHKGGSTGNRVWQYRLSVTSANRWRGTVFIGSTAYTVTDTGTPQAGRWDYLVMTRSGTTLTLYINGQAVATTTVSGALNTNTGILAIGRTGAAAIDYFNGAIDEVAVYNSALPSSRIQAHYNAGVGK